MMLEEKFDEGEAPLFTFHVSRVNGKRLQAVRVLIYPYSLEMESLSVYYVAKDVILAAAVPTLEANIRHALVNEYLWSLSLSPIEGPIPFDQVCRIMSGDRMRDLLDCYEEVEHHMKALQLA